MTSQRVHTVAKLLLFFQLILNISVSLPSPLIFRCFLSSFEFPSEFPIFLYLKQFWERLLKDIKQSSGSHLLEDFLGCEILVLLGFFLFLKTKCSSARIKFHLLHLTTTSSHKPIGVGGTTAFPSTALFLPVPLL